MTNTNQTTQESFDGPASAHTPERPQSQEGRRATHEGCSMKMQTPYFVMATECGGSLIFLNQWNLQQFAAKTSRRLSGLMDVVQESHADYRNSNEISIRNALDLMADLAWQLQQATAVLMDGPDQHQDQEWVEMEAEVAA